MKLLHILSVLACCFTLSSCDEPKQEKKMLDQNLIPRKVLFGNPDKIGVQVSPDAKYISYIAPLDGVLNLHIAPIGDLKNAKPMTFDKGRGVLNYSWSYDGQNLIYAQDKDGDENFALYRINIATGDLLKLTPEGSRSMVLKGSPIHPDEILVSINDRDPRYFDVYRVNIWTGEQKKIMENNQYSSFLADDALDIRFASKALPDGGQQIDQFVGLNDSVLFKVIPYEDTSYSGYIGMNAIGDTLYMFDSEGRDTTALYAVDLHTYERTLVAENAQADIDDVEFEPKTKKIQAYSYSYEKQKTIVLDSTIQKDMDYLSTLNAGELNITSRSYDDKFWIAAFMSDNAPISYYLYDREKSNAEFMFVHNSKLSNLALNPMHPVVIKASDGIEMVSYLTLPKSSGNIGADFHPEKSAPLILYVHGGPQARDGWGYNSIHQWLSDRGYAVLSVNYRGSLGFGKKFVRSGDGEWAGKMHQDLLDAANWAVAQGITTKEQIGIFGGSYGGYATLVGLAMTPDFFACGVDIVGPSNLVTLYESIPPYWEPFKVSLSKKMGGDTSTPEGIKVLESKSPLHYMQQIKKPLLIAQGANDPRVKRQEADQIVDAMKAKGIPVTYLLYPDEGHGFQRPENKQSFYAIAEHFLSSCLHGKAEPIGDDTQNSSMEILHGKDFLHLQH